MLKVTLYFTRNPEEDRDDIVKIYQDSEFVYRVVYRAGDRSDSKTTAWTGTRATVLSYVGTMFAAMKYDSDPFQEVQISTEIHPSVLFHVSTLDSIRVRTVMEDMVEDALAASFL